MPGADARGSAGARGQFRSAARVINWRYKEIVFHHHMPEKLGGMVDRMVLCGGKVEMHSRGNPQGLVVHHHAESACQQQTNGSGGPKQFMEPHHAGRLRARLFGSR